MHKLISMSKIKSPHSTITGAMVLEVHDFPISAGNIWLDNVQCFGSERQLNECPSSSLVSLTCNHTQDVGIRCQPQQGMCTVEPSIIYPECIMNAEVSTF